MKTLRKLVISGLAVILLTTTVMSFAVGPTQAAAGDNLRCECTQTAGQAAGVGTWKGRMDNGTGGRVDAPITVCTEASVSGACNPLTDTFISPGFKVPRIGDFLGNLIRLFFFIAGIVALVYLLVGALMWITSSGKDEKVQEARQQIQAAVLGLVVMVAVLTLVVIVEQVVFGGKVCLGISCPLQLGSFNLVK